MIAGVGHIRMVRWCAVLVAGVSLLGACSGGDDKDSDSAGDTAPDYGEEEMAAFCEALDQTSTETDPEIIFAAYDALEANAPPELSDDVEVFVANSREVSEAILALGDDPTQAEIEEAFAGVSDEARETVEALAATAQSGEIPDGPTGRVISHAVKDCDLG